MSDPNPPTIVGPQRASAPPPPEWVTAPTPWDAPPVSTALGGWGTWPGVARGAPPPPPPAPPRQLWSRSGLALTAVTALIAAVIGAGIGAHVRLHGSRPTLTTADAPAIANPPTPVAPLTPIDPTVPSTGPSTGEDPTTPATGGAPAAPSSGGSAAAAAIAAKVDPGVVDINTVLGYGNGSGAGTGMILTSTGEVLTNNHVIDGATSISVTAVSTGHTYKAAVVGTDPTQDIAVLRLQGASGLPTITTGDPSSLAVGDPVVAIGNAGGAGGTPAVVTGTVQGLAQTITASDPGGANAETLSGLIQTNAPIQPGDSGGPLVDRAGRVIGIDTAASAGRRFSAGAAVGFAIPITQAVNIAHQIESGRATSTIHIGLPGFLGVAIEPTGTGLGGSSTPGAVVAGVEAGTPAATAGLRQGDTITSVGGQAVSSAESLSSLTKAHHPGDKVTVGWTDQAGAAHSASVTLSTGPAD